jgi:hypothetical protein
LLTAGASHGFPPSRVLRPWPWSGFRPTPSLALRSCRNDLRHSPAPQSLDRPLLGLYRLRHLRTASPKATLLGFPHRLGPTHSDATPPGLSFSPRAGSHITAASPTVFRWWQRPTGVARIGLGAEASRPHRPTRGSKLRLALQSLRYRCSPLGVTASRRPLLELAARSEYLIH